MQRGHLWRLVVVVIVSSLCTACGQKATESSGASQNKTEHARIEHIDGTEISRVILSEDAAKRIDIHTDSVRDIDVGGSQQTVIPYAAVLYDQNGDTWAYTNPEPLTFVRHEISVDSIKGDMALLSEGPPTGTAVVTVGVAELFGAEFEFPEE